MASPPNHYVRVDSSIGDNLKFLEVDESLYLETLGLYVLMLCHCDRANTNGRITSKAVVGVRGIAPGRDDLIQEMLRVGLLVNGNGFSIPDYLDWQRSKEDKEARSRQASKAAAIMQANRSANSTAFRMQRKIVERDKDLKGKTACGKCESQGWVWITDDRAGTCPECKGKGEV